VEELREGMRGARVRVGLVSLGRVTASPLTFRMMYHGRIKPRSKLEKPPRPAF